MSPRFGGGTRVRVARCSAGGAPHARGAEWRPRRAIRWSPSRRVYKGRSASAPSVCLRSTSSSTSVVNFFCKASSTPGGAVRSPRSSRRARSGHGPEHEFAAALALVWQARRSPSEVSRAQRSARRWRARERVAPSSTLTRRSTSPPLALAGTDAHALGASTERASR